MPPLMPIKAPVWSWENSQERRLRDLANLQRLRLQMKPLLQDGSPMALNQASQLARAPETAKAVVEYKQNLLNGLKQHLEGQQAQPAPSPAPKKKKGLASRLKGAVGDAFDVAGDALGTAGGAAMKAMDYPSDIVSGALLAPFGELEAQNGQAVRRYDLGTIGGGLKRLGLEAATLGLSDANDAQIRRENELRRSLGQDVGGSLLDAVQGLRREGQSFYESPDVPAGVRASARVLTDPTMYIGPGAVGRLARTPAVASRLPGPVATALTSARSPIGGLLEGVTPSTLPGFAIGAGIGTEVANRADVPFAPEWMEQLALPMVAGGFLGGRTGRMKPPVAEIAFGKGPGKIAAPEGMEPTAPAVRRVIPNSTVIDEPTPARLGLAAGEERAISDQLTLRRREDGGFELEDPNGTIAVEPDEDLSWAYSAGSPLGGGTGHGEHRPLANDRLWFHSTRSLDYDVPDPDMSVGTATGITQGPGVYLAADPDRSAGHYGNRTFVTEFDGKVLDLTKPTTIHDPITPDGVTWDNVRDTIALRLRDSAESAYASDRELSDDLMDMASNLEATVLRDAKGVRSRSEMAHATSREVANSYVWRDDLAHFLQKVDADLADRRAPAAVIDELYGPFRGAAGGDGGGMAIVNNALAKSGVDALFHVSPNADGEVLIVLNGDKARVLGDARNAAGVLSQGKTWDEIRAAVEGAAPVAQERYDATVTRFQSDTEALAHARLEPDPTSTDRVRLVAPDGRVLATGQRMKDGRWRFGLDAADTPEAAAQAFIDREAQQIANTVKSARVAIPELRAFDEAGAASTGLASTLAGGAAGGLIGYGTGDSQEERQRNALIGAGLGAGAGALAVGVASKVARAQDIPSSDLMTEAKQAVQHAEEAAGAAPASPVGTSTSPFSLPEIEPGLTKRDALVNLVKRTVGIGMEDEHYATPAMRARAQAKYEAKSQAARLQAISRDLLRVFQRDNHGRIIDLPGQPTVRHLAAYYPEYEMLLTPEQRAAMAQLKAEVEPYRQILEEAGVSIEGSRADVERGGGFYLPRGRATLEGVEAPVREPSPTMRVGGKKGFEKEAKFATEMQGIAAGFEYADVDEALYHYALDAGNRAIDNWTAQYFKNVRDEAGEMLGKTPLERIDPALREKYEAAQRKLASVRARLQTAERRAGIYSDQSDELDAVLESLREAAPQDAVRGAARAGTAVRGLERQAERLRSERMGRPAGSEPVRISLPPTEANLTKAATLQKAIDTLREVIPDDVERLRTMDTTLERTKRRIEALRKRSGEWAGTASSLEQQLKAAEKRLNAVRAKYHRALETSRKSGMETGQIRMTALSGRQFPVAMANAANKYINAESKPIGRGAILLDAAEAFNQLFRGIRTSADVSFMGIQGLLGAVHDPAGYATALRLAWQAMADPEALGAYLRQFDAGRETAGRATSKVWAANGLHLNGADTEFAINARGLGRLGEKVGKAPVIKQSNRMFGYFGDGARLELADSMLETALASGRQMDEQTLREISMAANLMTGWSPQTFGGSVGQLAQFAPRFFASQLQLIGKAVTDDSLTGQQARRAFAKLAGVATLLTVAGNAASDEGLSPSEYLQPLKDGRYNPNFLRIRVEGQDVSLLGPWDSLVRGIVATATDDPAYFARTKASPVVGTLWDLFSGETMVGDNTRSWEYVARSFLPFSLSEVGRENPLGTAIASTGLKATPMSNSERLNELSQRMFGGDYWDLEPSQRQAVKDEHPDVWERYVEQGQNSKRQRTEALRAEYDARQQSRDAAFLSGALPRDAWITAYRESRDELNARIKEIYGDEPMTKDDIKTPTDAWRFEIQEATDPATGIVSWDRVDAWLGEQSAQDQAYIERNSGVSATPLVKLYRSLTSEYYDIPIYRGYTATQGSQINDLVAAARSAARTDSTAAQLVALRKVAAQVGGVDEKTVKGARRVLMGIMRSTTDRQRWRKQNPASALFFGAGPLTSKEQAAINDAMRPFARSAA